MKCYLPAIMIPNQVEWLDRNGDEMWDLICTLPPDKYTSDEIAELLFDKQVRMRVKTKGQFARYVALVIRNVHLEHLQVTCPELRKLRPVEYSSASRLTIL